MPKVRTHPLNLAPFSMLAENLPPASTSNNKQVEAFKETIRGKIGNPYPSNMQYAQYIGTESVLAGVTKALVNGRHRVLPNDRIMIEPIPGHGVTFVDPNFESLNITLESNSLIRTNLGFLVASLVRVDTVSINYNLAHHEEFTQR